MGFGGFAFLFALGLTIIPATTAARWIGDDYRKLMGLPVPVSLVYASVFLAGFAAMYFTVISMTDPTYRETFFAPTVRDLKKVLQTHAAYAMVVGGNAGDRRRRMVTHRAGQNLRRDLSSMFQAARRALDKQDRTGWW